MTVGDLEEIVTSTTIGNQALADSLGTKASQSDVDDLDEIVTSTTIGNQALADSLGTKASQSDVDDLDEIVTSITIGNQALADSLNILGVSGDTQGIKYFRVNSDKADAEATGTESIAIGPEAETLAENSTAIGQGAQVTTEGEGAIAFGQGALAGGGAPGAGGAGAVAIGRDSSASGTSSVALGDDAKAQAANAAALGASALASGTNSIAIGDSVAAGGNSFAAGTGATAATNDSIALGTSAGNGTGVEVNDPGQRHSFIAIGKNAGQNMDGNEMIAIGVGAGSNSSQSQQVSIGTSAGTFLNGERNVSLGFEANKNGGLINHATAIGGMSVAKTDAVAVGYAAKAETAAVALGAGAQAKEGNIALGNNSFASNVSGAGSITGEAFSGTSVSVGNAETGLTRRITNVQDGHSGYDAVNVRQLEALKASLGSFELESGGNVNYNPEGNTISVGDATAANHAVSLQQAEALIADGKPRFYSVNPNGDSANANGEGALGTNSDNSMAIGHAARIDSAEKATAVGYKVLVKSNDGTALGSGSIVDDAAGVAVGLGAYSRGINSLAIGTDAQTEQKANDANADNAIAIGTSARASEDSASALGHHATASGIQSSAMGFYANAAGPDAIAFGSKSVASGSSSQASGTGARASGANAQAIGTGARASGASAQASGTSAFGYASDGIALGTGAVSGFFDLHNQNPERNTAGIAIGSRSLADQQHALAMGVEAEARAKSSSAIGDGAKAQHEGSVALGSSAKTAAAVGFETYTIDKQTYTFAGTEPIATVSVGNDEEKRTITNVAAGHISAQSTDAINSSQLFQTNKAVDALGNNLDTAGESVAKALGGTSSYSPETHTVTAGLTVQGNKYTTVQDALNYVGQGWKVSAQGNNPTNVLPGETVDFKTGNDNLIVSKPADADEITYTLSNTLDLSTTGSVTIGDTLLNNNGLSITGGPSITKIGGINAGGMRITNVLPGQAPTDAVNVSQLTDAKIELTNEGMNFVGNDTTTPIHKNLGDTLTIKGDLASGAGASAANVRVDNVGGELQVKIADAPTFAGTVTAPTFSTSGANEVTISGETGTINNLTNKTFDPENFTSGQAATEDQLSQVHQLANTGWKVSAGDGESRTVAPGAEVNFSNTDGNISIVRPTETTDLVFNLEDDININNSITIGDTVGDQTIITGGNVTTNTLNVGGTNGLVVDATGKATYNSFELATLNDGLGFQGDQLGVDGNVFRNLTQTLTLQGGAAADDVVEEDNIGVIKNANGDGYDIRLAKDLVGLNSATFTNGTSTTVISHDGLRITGGPSVTVSGIDAGGKQITNVASGLDGKVLSELTDTSPELTNAANIGDLVTVSNELTTKGLDFVGDDLQNVHRDLGEQLSIKGGADANTLTEDNIGVIRNSAEDGLLVKLAKDISLGADGSLTTGLTKVDNDGLVVTDSVDNPTATTTVNAGVIELWANPTTTEENTIRIDAGAGNISGLTNITFDPDTTYTGGVAATQEQLGSAYEQLTETGLKFNANTGGEKTAALGSTVHVKGAAANDGATWATDFDGGQNIMTRIVQNSDSGDSVIRVALSKNLTGLETIILGENGTPGTAGKDGEPGIGLDGKDGVIGITGKDGVDGAPGLAGMDGSSADITVKMGEPGIDGNDGADGKTRIVYEKPNGEVEEVATLNDGLYFQGDQTGDDGNVARKLNDTLNLTGGATDVVNEANIGVIKRADGEGYDIRLAQDIRGLNTLQVGGNTGPILGGNEEGSLVLNPDGPAAKITNVADGTIGEDSTDAINGSQLWALGDSLKKVFGDNAAFDPETGGLTITPYEINDEDFGNVYSAINKLAEGWKINVGSGTPGESGGEGSAPGAGTGTGGPESILPGDQLTLVAGDNIIIEQKPKENKNVDIEISVNPNLVVDSVTAGQTVMDDSGVKVGDNVHLGDTGLTIIGGPTGDLAFTADKVDVGGNKIENVADGIIADGSKDAINGGQIKDISQSVADAFGGGSTVKDDGTVSAPSYTVGNQDKVVNNVGDALDVLNQGWTLTAEGNDTQVQAGDKVSLVNDDQNIVITHAANSGTVAFNLSDNIQVGESITIGGDTDNQTVINQGGITTHSVTTNNFSAGGGTMVVNEGSVAIAENTHIDMGGNRITNVAPGVDGTDVVNMNQLGTVANSLSRDIRRVDREARAGTASAAAMANLPQAYLPGKSMFAVAGAGHRGESGYAAGLSTISDNGKWVIKGSVAGNSRGDVTYGAGVGYQW
ncbi:Haemagglutinin [Oligella ureolytica]|uniref:YadA-like family protein n=1 Tax=Oligella ureolytica TaxID=90244 RepID=UPI000DFBFA6D|nr:YadA-like family protein [Oligella ureolytica]SUA54062.1 Haemagglutinin [Oligella ureolytica]